MATEKQIAANQRNAQRSTGPKSEIGKMHSRLNATKHGLAGELPAIEAELSPAFKARRAQWAAENQPHGPAAEWALDRAIAATFRIEACEKAVNEQITTVQQRARLSWHEDKATEAAALFGRLALDPILISRQLQTTLSGVVLMMEAWLLLLGVLEPGRDWTEVERSKVLDLLGNAPDLRSGALPIDPPEGEDPVTFHEQIALDELDRLEAFRDESLIPLDEMERRQAIQGDMALLSKEAKLLLRYEREAWRRYNQAMKEVKESAEPTEVAPLPVLPQPPKPRQTPVAPPTSSFEEQRRALQAEAAPYRQAATDHLASLGFVDEDAMLDELERRQGLMEGGAYSRAERTQSGVPVG